MQLGDLTVKRILGNTEFAGSIGGFDLDQR